MVIPVNGWTPGHSCSFLFLFFLKQNQLVIMRYVWTEVLSGNYVLTYTYNIYALCFEVLLFLSTELLCSEVLTSTMYWSTYALYVEMPMYYNMHWSTLVLMNLSTHLLWTEIFLWNSCLVLSMWIFNSPIYLGTVKHCSNILLTCTMYSNT